MKQMTFALIILLMVSCKKDDDFPLPNRCASAGVVAKPYSLYDNIFSGSVGGLSSGEVNSTTSYGDTMIWCVSNAILKTATGDLHLRNCIVLQEGMSIKVKYGGSATVSTSLLPDPDAMHYYTINQAVITNHAVEIIASLWKKNGTGRLDVNHEAVKVFVLDKATWSIISSQTVSPGSETLYGSALLREGAYTYIYGTRNVTWDKEVLVARIPTGSITQPWQFFDGYTWQASAAAARPIFNNTSDYFSVFRHEDRIYMVTNGALFGQEIRLYDAPTPESGWRPLKNLYCNSTKTPGYIAINGQVIAKENKDLIVAFSWINEDLVSLNNMAPESIKISNWK